ncbi:uncharacterized protein GGS22DRAFT_176782 [Annulohypoxylon maeteangense]|uniref:uncharacterized protein n=1 Tax=Annulohypoxylon maeteangense TaxID=1927788 RepID=UPI002007C73B|nr:uncharacterized protein GGS22DRAFT_176782 [Annulohypoxylon maeteangense]KAI0879775.1 hypothetical protein GGS22DRAFT_176782 [Annulohypoxylon maeteangense]
MAHQVHPTDSAWLAKKAEIDEWFKDCSTAPRTRVAYLQSAHASGKSTTFLKYLIENSYAAEPCYFIYVAARVDELNSARNYLVRNLPRRILSDISWDFEDEERPWQLTTYDHYVSWNDMLGEELYPDRVNMIVDVELLASVASELFFAKLLDRARWTREEPPVVANIFLMSPHRSERTISAFRRHVGDVAEINVPDINPQLTLEVVKSHEFPGVVLAAAADCLEQDEESRVVVIAHDTQFFDDAVGIRQIKRWKHPGLDESLCARQISVDSEAGLSAQVSKLRVLAFDYMSESTVLDTASGHTVKAERYLDRDEVERALSWALKTEEPHEVRIITNLSPAIRDQMPRSDERHDPAWNEDLPFLILTLLETFRDRPLKDLLMRRAPDDFAFTEMLLRLEMSQLVIQKNDLGIWALTKVGMEAYLLMVHSLIEPAFEAPVDIYVANLLARVTFEEDVKVKRVLIRMAAIALVEIPSLCNPSRPRSSVSLHDLRQQCAGIGHEQCWKGGLWAALGVYLASSERNIFGPGRGEEISGPLRVNCGVGWKVAELVAFLDDRLKVRPAANQIMSTWLDDEQVAVVETHLARSWFYRAVAAPCGRDRAIYDVASSLQVNVDQNSELLYLEGVRRDDREAGHIFAIYGSLRGRGPEDLEVSSLTYIPRHILKALDSEARPGWADAIATTYPMH